MTQTDAVKRIYELADWYDKQARKNRRALLIAKAVQLFCATSIPIVSLSNFSQHNRLATALLGAVVAFVEGISQLMQFQANWLRYRMARESLRREQLLFELGGGSYRGAPDPAALLVDRTDAILNEEVTRFTKLHETPASPKA